MKKVTMASLISGLFVLALCLVLPLSAYSADKLIVKGTDGTTTKFVVTDAGYTGIGTATPVEALDVVASNNGLIRLSNVETDSTNKFGRVILRHYSNSQLPVYLFGSASTPTNNFVAIGGGSTIGNAATQVDFYTASNNTTPQGTSRLSINSAGNIIISNLASSYSGGSAYVCVSTTGQLFASETSCP